MFNMSKTVLVFLSVAVVCSDSRKLVSGWTSRGGRRTKDETPVVPQPYDHSAAFLAGLRNDNFRDANQPTIKSESQIPANQPSPPNRPRFFCPGFFLCGSGPRGSKPESDMVRPQPVSVVDDIELLAIRKAERAKRAQEKLAQEQTRDSRKRYSQMQLPSETEQHSRCQQQILAQEAVRAIPSLRKTNSTASLDEKETVEGGEAAEAEAEGKIDSVPGLPRPQESAKSPAPPLPPKNHLRKTSSRVSLDERQETAEGGGKAAEAGPKKPPGLPRRPDV